MSFIRSLEGQLRLKYSRSLAYDATINSRNLEDAWYPMWNLVLTELIEDHPNLHVAPQCTLWVKKIRPPPSRDVTSDEDETSSTNETHPEPGHSALKQPTLLLQSSTRNTRNSQRVRDESSSVTQDDIQTAGRRRHKSIRANSGETRGGEPPASASQAAQNPPNNISHHTGPRVSNTTVAAPDALERIPDFAIFYTQVERKAPKPLHDGFKVKILGIPVIVEVKPFVSRQLVEGGRQKAIQNVIENTHDQVFEQAGLFFLEFPDVESIHAVIACGPYWTTAEIKPKHIRRSIWKELRGGIDPDHPYEPPSTARAAQCRWKEFVEIESPTSNRQLGSLRAVLARFPVDDAEKILGGGADAETGLPSNNA